MSDDLLDRARKYANTKCQSTNGTGGQMTNPDGTTVSFPGPSWPCGMCHSCRSINERHLLADLVARCERAEADADRLVRCLFLLQASDDMSEHALRLHDEAKALR